MTAGEYIKLYPELKERVIDHLFDVDVPSELEYKYTDSEMGVDPDGQFCEQEDVERALLDVELNEFDLDYIERRGIYA